MCLSAITVYQTAKQPRYKCFRQKSNRIASNSMACVFVCVCVHCSHLFTVLLNFSTATNKTTWFFEMREEGIHLNTSFRRRCDDKSCVCLAFSMETCTGVKRVPKSEMKTVLSRNFYLFGIVFIVFFLIFNIWWSKYELKLCSTHEISRN